LTHWLQGTKQQLLVFQKQMAQRIKAAASVKVHEWSWSTKRKR